MSRLTRAVLCAVGAVAASAALAVPAHAASVVPTTECPTAALSQPFAAWGDSNWYKLVDGGAFTNGAPGWKLTGGAAVEDGRLSLPAGSSATSAPVCVGRAEPTMRFFAGGSGLLAPLLTVSVQFQLVSGVWVNVPIGIDTGSAFNPSAAMQIVANYLPPAGEYTSVRFVFSPLLGSWDVDDVFVDPRGSN